MQLLACTGAPAKTPRRLVEGRGGKAFVVAARRSDRLLKILLVDLRLPNRVKALVRAVCAIDFPCLALEQGGKGVTRNMCCLETNGRQVLSRDSLGASPRYILCHSH